MTDLLLGAWRYRHYILSAIINELRGRFVRSRLGGLWMIVHPLAQVAIFALILSAVLSAKLPGIDHRFAYAIYLTAGILAWSLFFELVTTGLNLFIQHGNLLKKIVFPKITLPLIAAGTALLNNIGLLLAIFVVFALLGHWPTVQVLWLPLLLLLTLALGLGLGLVLGVLNVFIRDIGQLVPILLQFGFWLTPIVYMPSIIPERLQGLLWLNPLYPLVSAYHNVLVFGQPPAWQGLVIIAVIAAGLLALALFLFRRASAEMTDVL